MPIKDQVITIIGQGLVGSLIMQVALSKNPKKIIAVDTLDFRCKLATKLGAKFVINSSKNSLYDYIAKITESKKSNVVIEAVGGPSGKFAFEQSLEICKKAIDVRPDFGFAHRHITSMLTYEDAQDPHIVEMESIYNSDSLALKDRVELAFGLGKCFEDVKNYKKAFY